ncbi:MAG: elongation factor G, partial [Candidatus Hydrothermota bacterium]
MSGFDLEKVRNIGFAAHIDAGKTTVTEHVLFYSGKTHKLGKVDAGNTETDYLILEKLRGITITAAAVTCYWRGHQINIIDTPGHVDFTIEVERSMRVLDGIVIIFSAVEGVEPQSESVWRQADRYNVARIAFINKLDRIGADPFRVLEQMKERFPIKPLVLELPVGLEADFKGVIDLVRRKVYTWADDEIESGFGKIYEIQDADMNSTEVSEYYEEMVYTLSEIDESILDEYLDKGFVDEQKLIRAIRKGTISRRFVPVLMGAALRHKGIQPLMEAVVDYLPSPLDLPPVEGIDPRTGETVSRKPSKDEPFSALVFKIQIDKHAKMLYYLRIYSGKLRYGQKVLNVNRNRIERIQNIYRMHAQKKEQMGQAVAGDIVAVVGLKDVLTGYTLADKDHPILFGGIEVPEPVVSIAVEPRNVRDQQELENKLHEIEREDPTIRVKTDEETGQLIVSGMGELHLEILIDRLKRDFNLDVRAGKPQVTYRETISTEVEFAQAVDFELGGTKHKGYVKLRVTPLDQGRGRQVIIPIEIREQLDEGKLQALKLGVEECLDYGPKMGYPVVDVRVEILEVGIGTEYTPLGTRE